MLREADKLGIEINRHFHVERIDEALPLIRNVEVSHGALPNPWAKEMLEHMDLINGAFLTATIKGQLVGCGLLLEDSNSQMTTGFGGQSYVPTSTAKINRLRQMLDSIGSNAWLEVDGGIKPGNAKEIVEAGADVLVAGSAVFGRASTVSANIARLRAAIRMKVDAEREA